MVNLQTRDQQYFVARQRKKGAELMKVLLQQLESGLFVGLKSELVGEVKRARIFGTTSEAMDFCFETGMKDVEVLLRFAKSAQELRFRPFSQREIDVRLRRFRAQVERLEMLQKQLQEKTLEATETIAEIEQIALRTKQWEKAFGAKPKGQRANGLPIDRPTSNGSAPKGRATVRKLETSGKPRHQTFPCIEQVLRVC